MHRTGTPRIRVDIWLAILATSSLVCLAASLFARVFEMPPGVTGVEIDSFELLATLLALSSLLSACCVSFLWIAIRQQRRSMEAAADAIEAHRIVERKHAEIESTNVRLRKALDDLQENFEAMVHGWVRAVEAKDPHTAGHSERVTRLCLDIGGTLGLPLRDLRILEMGAMIHDVGKIGVPDDVLLKPGTLDAAEFEVIKRHSAAGAQMIERIPLFRECLPIVRWHHEKLDGSGYPDGLSGDQIPLMVRIATIADMYDAMISSRVYRDSMTPEEALGILRSDADAGKIDAKILGVLTDIVQSGDSEASATTTRAA